MRGKKKEMWDKFVKEAQTSQELWGVWSYSTRKQCAKMPTLEHEGKSFNTFKEKEEVLRSALFVEAAEKDKEARCGGDDPRIEITKEYVRGAYRNIGTWKAPGEDESIVKAIKEATEVMVEWIREAY